MHGLSEAKRMAMSESIVRTTCPACGDLVLTPGDLKLQRDHVSSRYRFTCPCCDQVVVRDVAPGIVQVLRAAGVEEDGGELPPISEIEIALLRADLERPDWLLELRRSLSGS